MYTIRRIVRADIKSCIALINANKEHMGDLHTERTLLDSSEYNKYWVAQLKEKIIGMIGFSNLNNGIGMILSLCIDPKQHGKGIGKDLVKTVKEYAQKNQFRKLLLLTHEKNKPMMHLAISENFIPEGLLQKHFRTGKDVIYFSYFVDKDSDN